MSERKRTPGQAAAYQRAYREARKAVGLCTDCGEQPSMPGRTKCTRHLDKLRLWWLRHPEYSEARQREYGEREREYARSNQRAIRKRRIARSDDEIAADRARLRPDGLKWCKRRESHDGPLPFTAFSVERGAADGLRALCRKCDGEIYKRRAEKHWRAAGIPFACTYCGGPYEHVDHVVPRALGGTDDVANLMPACRSCNQSKSDHSLEAWLMLKVAV